MALSRPRTTYFSAYQLLLLERGLWGGGRPPSQKHFSRPRLHEAETSLPYLINISFFFHRHRGCRAFYRYIVFPHALFNPAINNCAGGKVIREWREERLGEKLDIYIERERFLPNLLAKIYLRIRVYI